MSTTAVRKSLMAITVAAFCAAAISLLALAAPASAAGKLINNDSDVYIDGSRVTAGTIECSLEGDTHVIKFKSATLKGAFGVYCDNGEKIKIINSGTSYIKGGNGELKLGESGKNNSVEFAGKGTLNVYPYIDAKCPVVVRNTTGTAKYPLTVRAEGGLYAGNEDLSICEGAKLYASNSSGTAVYAGPIEVDGYLNAKGYKTGVDAVSVDVQNSSSKIYATSTCNFTADSSPHDGGAVICEYLSNRGYIYAKSYGKHSVAIFCSDNLSTYKGSTIKAYGQESGSYGIYFREDSLVQGYVLSKGYKAGVFCDDSSTLDVNGGKVYAYGVNAKGTRTGDGIQMISDERQGDLSISSGGYVKAKGKYYGVSVSELRLDGAKDKLYAYESASSAASIEACAVRCDRLDNDGYVYASASGKYAYGLFCDGDLLSDSGSTIKAYAKHYAKASGGHGIYFKNHARFENAYVVAKGYVSGIEGRDVDSSTAQIRIAGSKCKIYAYGVNTKDAKTGNGIHLRGFGEDCVASINIMDGAYVKVRAKSSASKYGIFSQHNVTIDSSKVEAYAKSGNAIVGYQGGAKDGVSVMGKSTIKVNGSKKSNTKVNF